MTWDEMVAVLRARADVEIAEGGSTFMGWPDRWWDVYLRRCENDHVSSRTLKSEALGRDACLACMGHVHMTFPEDTDGPLTCSTSAERCRMGVYNGFVPAQPDMIRNPTSARWAGTNLARGSTTPE